MLDLIEGAKIVVGKISTGEAAAAAGLADVMNMKDMHRVWAIATFSGTSGPVINTEVAETQAGGSNSSENPVGIWTCLDSTTLDRWTKSTALVGTFDDTNDGAIAMLFDPSVADTSDSYFVMAHSSYVGALNITYIGEPRYGGYRQTIATTSST